MSREVDDKKGHDPVRPPGFVASVAPALALSAFVAAGTVAVDGVIAVYTGSYLAWSIAFTVAAFWVTAAVLTTAVLSVVFAWAVFVVKNRYRGVVMSSLVLGIAFVLHALIIRETMAEKDGLAKAVLASVGFIVLCGVALAVVAGALAGRRERGGISVYLIAATAMLFCSGAAYFAPDEWGAIILAPAPLAVFAIVGAVVGRAASARRAGIVAAVFLAVCSCGLYGIAVNMGEAPLAVIDAPVPHSGGPAGRPNIVLIVIDTCRAEYTSVCGGTYPTTPNLALLAADSRSFSKAVSVDSCTLPSHASLFTGKYPREHGAHATTTKGVMTIEKYRPYFNALDASQPTLATLLSEAGYDTGAISGNYARLCRQLGLGQGFSYYSDLPRFLLFVPGRSPVYKVGMDYVDRILGMNGKLLQTYYSARTVTRRAGTWLDRERGGPFFLFLNYMDPHYPYSAVRAFDHIYGEAAPYDMRLRQQEWQDLVTRYVNTGQGVDDGLLRSAVRQYHGELAYTDYWIGRLVDTLKERGLYDNTLLIVTSDHGEFFGEHQLLDHSYEVYEEGVRVPLLVKYPGQIYAGEVDERRVSNVDVFATVLDAAGVPPGDVSSRVLGESAHPVIIENYESGLQSKRYGPKAARTLTVIYSGDYKYYHSTDGRHRLFDLSKDGGEKVNLIETQSDTAERIEKELAAWLSSTGDAGR